jgi:hypothetical protein
MSDRTRRKRKSRNTVARYLRARVLYRIVNTAYPFIFCYSNIHYVGYVEDEESVEAIMKKFEELDRIQKEFSSISVTANPSNNSEGKDSEMDSTDTPRMDDQVEPPQGLTEEQLQEVFKQTSSFTVRSAMMNSDDMDGLDDVEIWQLQYQDGLTDEIYEEE